MCMAICVYIHAFVRLWIYIYLCIDTPRSMYKLLLLLPQHGGRSAPLPLSGPLGGPCPEGRLHRATAPWRGGRCRFRARSGAILEISDTVDGISVVRNIRIDIGGYHCCSCYCILEFMFSAPGFGLRQTKVAISEGFIKRTCGLRSTPLLLPC